MSRLIGPINVAPYGAGEDYRCCESAAASYISGCAVVAATDITARPRHGLYTGQAIFVQSITGGSPLATSTPYWAHVIDGNTFKICASEADAAAGTPVNILTNSTELTLLRGGLNPHYGITSRIYTTTNTTISDTTSSGLDPLDILMNWTQVTPGVEFESSARFGVCCDYDIEIDIAGYMRVADGLDSVEILLNDVQVYFAESSEADGIAYWDTKSAETGMSGADYLAHWTGLGYHLTYEFSDSYTVLLSQAVCGDVIEIICRSGAVDPTDSEEAKQFPVFAKKTITVT